MIWTWVGAGEAPTFPNFVFNDLPGTQVKPVSGIMQGNWFQLMENLFDPLHTPLLHGPGNKDAWGPAGTPPANAGSPIYESYNTPPKRPPLPESHFDVRKEPYGFRYFFESARDPDNFVPTGFGRESNWGRIARRWPPGAATPGSGWATPRIRSSSRTSRCAKAWAPSPTGPRSTWSIPDRTKEHLGPADTAVIRGRRIFLDAARAHARGGAAHGVDADLSHISLPDGPEHAPVEPEADSIPVMDYSRVAGVE
jgi:hypothetical protein